MKKVLTFGLALAFAVALAAQKHEHNTPSTKGMHEADGVELASVPNTSNSDIKSATVGDSNNGAPAKLRSDSNNGDSFVDASQGGIDNAGDWLAGMNQNSGDSNNGAIQVNNTDSNNGGVKGNNTADSNNGGLV